LRLMKIVSLLSLLMIRLTESFTRPLVTQEILEETILAASKVHAAAPALPITDTVKRAEEGRTRETVDRSDLWAVQTPQVFEAVKE
ncbi:MAG: 2-C-methyl-D-erythritol 4-phosphate cytidylyltransferase, partial [Lentisphaeria bacterium]|nr:2-C-methyl-D-erythritol 4-phosphate cytidylyltransferase [Lentisphaeria bacterium]